MRRQAQVRGGSANFRVRGPNRSVLSIDNDNESRSQCD